MQYRSVLAIAPVLAIASAQSTSLSGMNIPVFVDPGCDYGGDYTYFSLGSGYPSCTTNSFAGTGFQQVNSDYNATFLIPNPGDGCKIFIRAPSNVDNPGCGEVIAIFTESTCRTLTFPDPFDINFCCGDDDCASAINAKKTKRDETSPADLLKEAHANRIAAVKPKKRDTGNCAYSGGGAYTTDGPVQTVGSTIDCTQPNGCSDMFSTSVTSGSSQSFGVSESTEAGLFDIIQETISFSYDYTYMTSATKQTTVSYNIADGTQGYVSWAPTLQCTDGSFDGSDCDGQGIPTGQSGTSCVPVTDGNVDGGQPEGTSQFVTIN